MYIPSRPNHKNYNFLACDWFKKVLFSTNSLAKLLSDSLLLDSLLLDSLLSDKYRKASFPKSVSTAFVAHCLEAIYANCGDFLFISKL